jgi:hypothetical protein
VTKVVKLTVNCTDVTDRVLVIDICTSAVTEGRTLVLYFTRD